jgi:hypothetical protein
MARGEYLICREGNPLPSGTTLPKVFYRPPASGMVLRTGGDQVRNRPAVSSDGDCLSVFDCPKEFC